MQNKIKSNVTFRANLDEEKDNDEVISSAEPGHEGNTKNPMDGLILNDYFSP